MFLLFSGLNRQLLTARHSSCVIFLLYLFFLYFSQYNTFPPNCGLLFLFGYSIHLHNGIVTNHFMLYRALHTCISYYIQDTRVLYCTKDYLHALLYNRVPIYSSVLKGTFIYYSTSENLYKLLN